MELAGRAASQNEAGGSTMGYHLHRSVGRYLGRERWADRRYMGGQLRLRHEVMSGRESDLLPWSRAVTGGPGSVCVVD